MNKPCRTLGAFAAVSLFWIGHAGATAFGGLSGSSTNTDF
jgi:hypothetical protein